GSTGSGTAPPAAPSAAPRPGPRPPGGRRCPSWLVLLDGGTPRWASPPCVAPPAGSRPHPGLIIPYRRRPAGGGTLASGLRLGGDGQLGQLRRGVLEVFHLRLVGLPQALEDLLPQLDGLLVQLLDVLDLGQAEGLLDVLKAGVELGVHRLALFGGQLL